MILIIENENRKNENRLRNNFTSSCFKFYKFFRSKWGMGIQITVIGQNETLPEDNSSNRDSSEKDSDEKDNSNKLRGFCRGWDHL